MPRYEYLSIIFIRFVLCITLYHTSYHLYISHCDVYVNFFVYYRSIIIEMTAFNITLTEIKLRKVHFFREFKNKRDFGRSRKLQKGNEK